MKLNHHLHRQTDTTLFWQAAPIACQNNVMVSVGRDKLWLRDKQNASYREKKRHRDQYEKLST